MFDWIKKIFHREQTGKTEKIVSAIVFFSLIFGFGYRGSMMTPDTWTFYDALVKPLATPPSWVFPVAWTLLFILIGLAGYFAWNHFESDLWRKIFAALYLFNSYLVYLWSNTFFAQQSITSALHVIVVMIIVIEAMILSAFKTNHRSAYLLIPYLLWVLFAAYLNTSIITLN